MRLAGIIIRPVPVEVNRGREAGTKKRPPAAIPHKNTNPPSVHRRWGITSVHSWYLTSIVYLSFVRFAVCVQPVANYRISIHPPKLDLLYCTAWADPFRCVDLAGTAVGIEFICSLDSFLSVTIRYHIPLDSSTTFTNIINKRPGSKFLFQTCGFSVLCL